MDKIIKVIDNVCYLEGIKPWKFTMAVSKYWVEQGYTFTFEVTNKTKKVDTVSKSDVQNIVNKYEEIISDLKAERDGLMSKVQDLEEEVENHIESNASISDTEVVVPKELVLKLMAQCYALSDMGNQKLLDPIRECMDNKVVMDLFEEACTDAVNLTTPHTKEEEKWVDTRTLSEKVMDNDPDGSIASMKNETDKDEKARKMIRKCIEVPKTWDTFTDEEKSWLKHSMPWNEEIDGNDRMHIEYYTAFEEVHIRSFNEYEEDRNACIARGRRDHKDLYGKCIEDPNVTIDDMLNEGFERWDEYKEFKRRERNKMEEQWNTNALSEANFEVEQINKQFAKFGTDCKLVY